MAASTVSPFIRCGSLLLSHREYCCSVRSTYSRTSMFFLSTPHSTASWSRYLPVCSPFCKYCPSPSIICQTLATYKCCTSMQLAQSGLCLQQVSITVCISTFSQFKHDTCQDNCIAHNTVFFAPVISRIRATD